MDASAADQFATFAGRYCGLELEPFQLEIAEAMFSRRREILVLLPRGNGKTTLMAAAALWHLLTTPQAEVLCCAASREQARHLFNAAVKMAQAPGLRKFVTVRHAELRANSGFIRVIAADAPKQHGWTPSLVFVDELHAHPNAELYLTMRTSMLKRPGAQMVTISTAGSDVEGPLGRLRARALGLPHVERSGALTRAYGPSLAMLEWACPEDADVDDPHVVKQANPASWITTDGLAEQRQAVHDLAFRRYHANQWVAGEHHWLPPGAWQRCAGDARVSPGERVWVGVDVGGERSASAVVWITQDLRVGCQIFQGTEAVLAVADKVHELAAEYQIMEVAYDPWRFQAPALELAERGIPTVEFPQSNQRMGPASERLHAAIVEGRLRHPDDPGLNAHVRAAIARDTPRGWRIDKLKSRDQIDAVVALAMAVERAEQPGQDVRLLGWL